MKKNGVIVLAGPTASGKTALSLELARIYNGEIVSADSMQVYRGMDIGTAKATPEEQAKAVHHMLDVADPGESFSVSRYVEMADSCCRDILSRGKTPVITGGTGLYIDSLISGRSFSDGAGESPLREELYAEYDEKGGGHMLERLAQFDPARAQKLHPSDRRRIVRAIEIYLTTGITATEHDALTKLQPPAYEAAYIVLGFADRAMLYERIDRRVDIMVAQGLFDEVSSLLSSGIPAESTAMQAIGYKEAAAALRGEISREEAVDLIKMASRRYAKRQLTWFRKTEGALFIERSCAPVTEDDLALCIPFINSRIGTEE